MARLISPRIASPHETSSPQAAAAGPQLIPPLSLAQFYPPAQSSTFHLDLQKDLDDIDKAAADTAGLAFAIEIPDVVAIAKSMDDPLALVDDGLAFEAADSASTFLDDAIAAAPAIDQGFLNNETSQGKIGPKGATIGLVVPPIAAVPSTGLTQPLPPGTPAIPSVGSGNIGPKLAGAHTLLLNINRPGDPGHFRVGDPWQLAITAPAGTQIYAVASHNGVLIGQSSFGPVPATGLLTLHGTFTADQLGSWIENWYGGAKFIGQVSFQVS